MYNISQELLSQLNNRLDPQEKINEIFPIDNNFYHFKNGKREPSSSHIWVIGTAWEYKGNTYFSVTCGDWRSSNIFTVKSYDPDNVSKSFKKFEKEEKEKIDRKRS